MKTNEEWAKEGLARAQDRLDEVLGQLERGEPTSEVTESVRMAAELAGIEPQVMMGYLDLWVECFEVTEMQDELAKYQK